MLDVQAIAKIVDDAALHGTEIPQLSETGHILTLEQSYKVQNASLERRYARGEKLIGIKMGFTSKAKQVQMGLSDECWGRLTDKMLLANGAEINIDEYVHPRAEPELCFRLKHDLYGNVSRDEAFEAIDAVASAVEIIDSRYKNFKFNLPDVCADNSSSSSFVVGEWCDPNWDFSNLKVSLQINNQSREEGATHDILGDPVEALRSGVRLASEQNITLKKGFLIMAGAATAATKLSRGDQVRACIEKMDWPHFSVKT